MSDIERLEYLIEHGDEAYIDWYQAYLESKYAQSGVEFTSGKLSIEEIKDFFLNWLLNNLSDIKQLICPTYVTIKEKYARELELVGAIADMLKVAYDFYPELSVLLFKYGLDKLCACYDDLSKSCSHNE